MCDDHCYKGGLSRQCQGDGWSSLLYREGRAGSVKEMVVKHGYTRRAGQGVLRRWGVTMAIQGGQSLECQGDGW